MMALSNFTSSLEMHFDAFRKNIIGIEQSFNGPFGAQKIVYTDWTASGRLYRPIEEKLTNVFGPYVANTHTETTASGTAMTLAYHESKRIIKKHVNADENDVLINSGSGMTGVINKFQRILGMRVSENFSKFIIMEDADRPVVFISHMEHHSNQTSWLETIADVVVVPCDNLGLFSIENLQIELDKFKDRRMKIASITACSNVTGIQTPYHEVARRMHKNNGLCFVDFACSAPYIHINMHPDEESYLDAIFFSPHKFLGGPGTSGVLIFNKNLYKNNVPDCPGGGTVAWTNPWGGHKYLNNIEDREDGGTPGFLQVIKTALTIQLKEKMEVEKILKREHELVGYIFERFSENENIVILAGAHKERLGVISFYINRLHFNLGVKLLNDRYGIQTRGGCSCAGTYGHFLFELNQESSQNLINQMSAGSLSVKPGWIRLSIHPTTTNAEIKYICDSILALADNHTSWSQDYIYNALNNEFSHIDDKNHQQLMVERWFEF